MSDTFNLDRENNIDALVDANGKQWRVVVNKQNGLCHARPHPDREDAVIPKTFAGQWTKPSLLIPKIRDFVVATWDKAEEENAKAERKRAVAAEAAKAKKATDDTRAASK